MSKSVSDQIIEILTRLGVKQIFGIPGDTIDSLLESIRKQKEIEFIILRHEETGAFAASAQAKLTGKLGVCVACQGPGAIHLLNGLYDAALDRVPVLAITGQVDTSLIGTRMVQEINQLNLFNDVAIYNEEVRSAANLPRTLKMAVRDALNLKGVAHLSIPSDVMRATAVDEKIEDLICYDVRKVPTDEALDQAATILNKSNKVTILYGGGSQRAKDALIKISQVLQAPLVHTTRSKDILDNHLENYIGGIGLMGVAAANHAVSQCDALLVVGCSFAFKEYYPSKASIIQIEIDASRMAERTPITLGLLGDSAPTLSLLIERIIPKTDDAFLQHAKQMKIRSFDFQQIFNRSSKPGKYIHPQALTERMGALAADDAIFCVGSGSVTIYCNNYLHLNGKQRFLWSWNLASLGWTLPAALGCKLSEPHRQVIAPVGDGDFHMLIADFITFVKYQLPVTFIIYNNSSYRFIEFEESGEGNPPFGTHLLNPDYVKLAQAHGALGIKVKNYDDIDAALTEAFKSNQPAIVDVDIDPNELFIPPHITPQMAISFIKSKIKGW